MKTCKIGSIEIKNNICLAPMAGLTDIAFRVLAKKQGVGLVWTEMVSVNAINQNNGVTMRMTEIDPNERPVAIQLFGQQIEQIERAVKKIEDRADIIDFNMGCPATHIIRAGSCSALLGRPEKVKKIIETIRKSTKKPITVKIRIGLNDYKKNHVRIAKIIEQAGADAIIVHGRTVAQKYSGIVNYKAIKEVKDAVSIPVIGNGDIVDGASAKKMFDETGCDAIMVGRAAAKDPFIFKRIIHYLKTGKELPEPTDKEKINHFFEYAKL
ncbi:tRNA dihydrouridine synthase DusB, partial [Candidatus Woesearchaeota archaeon]|nr:tRNA dihydrouridine synthase DusB [Candidatus Woesearchaeota archaeon]